YTLARCRGASEHAAPLARITGKREAKVSERTWYETISAEGNQLLDKVREAIREGHVRRVVIKQKDRSIAEFPLTVGVVGAVLAPMLAAIGAIAALATDCTIEIERTEEAEPASAAASQEPQSSRASWGASPRQFRG